MLNGMMIKHKVYSVQLMRNENTYEEEKTKVFNNDIYIAISDAGYQQYLSNDLELQQYSFVGITKDLSVPVMKGNFIDNMEVVHVLKMGKQYVLYLKEVSGND